MTTFVPPSPALHAGEGGTTPYRPAPAYSAAWMMRICPAIDVKRDSFEGIVSGKVAPTQTAP